MTKKPQELTDQAYSVFDRKNPGEQCFWRADDPSIRDGQARRLVELARHRMRWLVFNDETLLNEAWVYHRIDEALAPLKVPTTNVGDPYVLDVSRLDEPHIAHLQVVIERLMDHFFHFALLDRRGRVLVAVDTDCLIEVSAAVARRTPGELSMPTQEDWDGSNSSLDIRPPSSSGANDAS